MNVETWTLIVPVGPLVIVVSGGVVSTGSVVSTVKVRLAGVASVLPAASVARTSKVCEPSASAVVVNGVVHDAKDPRRPGTRTSSPPRSR